MYGVSQDDKFTTIFLLLFFHPYFPPINSKHHYVHQRTISLPIPMEDSMITLALLLLSFILTPENQPSIVPLEQNAVYRLLHSLNPTLPWTTLNPDNLCISPPHFILCDSQSHIVEITSPPCSPNATLNNPLLFTPFTHLRKLSFSKCFNNTLKPIHPLPSLPPSLQQLILVDNPTILSPLQPFLHNLTSLKKLVLIGNGFLRSTPAAYRPFS